MDITNQQLSNFLISQAPANIKFIDKIKIGYRPYICPFKELLQSLPENSSVFDIGCGSGMFLSLVAKFKKPNKLGGIEIYQQLIDNSKAVLKSDNRTPVSLKVFDGRSIPDDIRDYDYIYLIDVIHHVPKSDQINFLEQIYCKMRAGAKLIVKDIDADSRILSKFNKAHDLLLSGEIGNELGMNFLSGELKNIGFRIVSINKQRMFFYPHFTLVCEKNT